MATIFSGAVNPFISSLLSRGGDFNEALLQSDSANLQKALQNAALAGATTNPNFSYLGSDFGGRTTTGPKGQSVAGLAPRAKAFADELLFGNFTGSGNEGGSGQYVSDLNPIERLRAAGFGYDDIGKVLDSYGGAQTFGYEGDTQSVLDAQQAYDAANEYYKLRPDLKPERHSFGDFINDAFQSPVGAFILAGLTGGLGGLGAIGSGLATAAGGTLTGAAASALGGAAIGGLGAGLRGDNIIKGAALGGLGGGLAGSGLGNATLGEAGGSALRGGLLGGANAAVSGGDVLQGLLGGAVQGGVTSGLNQLGGAIKGGLLGNAFNGDIDFNDIEPNSFPPSDGDTFNDQTDYFALTPDNLRIRAEFVANDPNSTPAQIDQSIADYQRAVELSQMASPFNTEGAYRVDVKGVGQEIPSSGFGLGGLLSDPQGIGASGGAGGFQQVPNVVRPTQPGQPTSTAKGPNLNLGGLLGLIGGGAALGGLLGDSGGSGGSVPAMAQPQRNYIFDPRVNQYPGDPNTYGQVNIGDFRFYEPGLKVS